MRPKGRCHHPDTHTRTRSQCNRQHAALVVWSQAIATFPSTVVTPCDTNLRKRATVASNNAASVVARVCRTVESLTLQYLRVRRAIDVVETHPRDCRPKQYACGNLQYPA